jgi:hypothetical protein
MFYCRSIRSQSPTIRETHHRSRSMSPSRKARGKSPSPQPGWPQPEVVNSNPKGIVLFYSDIWMSKHCIFLWSACRKEFKWTIIAISPTETRAEPKAETRAGSPIPTPSPLARSTTVARRPPLDPKHFVCFLSVYSYYIFWNHFFF